MKITIIGSHSTGKTTICNDFIKLHKEFFLIPEIARIFGIEKITERNDNKIQYDMLQTQINIEKYHKNFISDRSVLDFAIYDIQDKILLNKCINLMNDRYDFIFYIPIKISLEDDGFRNIDINFQKEIDRRFLLYMPKNTIYIESNKRIERIKEIEEIIKG